jgi:putative CocE/NonD family hydrolase
MGGGTGRKNPGGRLDHGGRWLAASDWPLPDAKPTLFFLDGNGLARQPPSQKGTLSYNFDPRDPVPTVGGALASGAPLMAAGAYDQRESKSGVAEGVAERPLSDREDVLVFQTEPLDQTIEVVGPVSAVLFVSSSAVDTDFTIKLIDVYPPSEDYPEGFAMNLTHGILRLRFRNGWERPELMEPGSIYRIEIQAFPTANLFALGHRIRLDVSSSNFPHFDINPNNGTPAGESAEPVVARNSIYFAPETPSHIILPLLQAP